MRKIHWEIQFFIYIFMAESAELADKLQGSVCRLVSVSVNFQVCDWGATDIHWLCCEHEAGGCSSLIYRYRRFGLLWFWKRHFTSPQRACVKLVNLNRPLYSTSEQSNNDQGSQVIQSTGTVLWEQREISSVHAFENSWTGHGDSTALGRAGGQGHDATCPRTAGEEGTGLGQFGSR